MISTEFIMTMARYNQWQNRSLYEAGDSLSDEARKLDRGAFFGSIHETLCHVLWGDMMWTSRFAGLLEPDTQTIKNSGKMIGEWKELKLRRAHLDVEIFNWAQKLSQQNITKEIIRGELTWVSTVLNRQVSRPLGEIIVHFFNHQTHHRGQVHAMITAAGGKPDDTDLFVMAMRTDD